MSIVYLASLVIVILKEAALDDSSLRIRADEKGCVVGGKGGGTAARILLDVWPSRKLKGWEIDEVVSHYLCLHNDKESIIIIRARFIIHRKARASSLLKLHPWFRV